MNDDFIDDFIKEYEKLPCLWQTTHVDFKNRKKRQEAYQKLIECASKHNEIYNIERTKQKINNLRCAFRHQLKKYTELKNNPKGGKEDSYCPKRKYFQSLMFLMNEEKQVIRKEQNSKENNTTKSEVDFDDIKNDDSTVVATEKKLKLTLKQQKAQRKLKKELDAITPTMESDNDEQLVEPIKDLEEKLNEPQHPEPDEDDDFKSLITISNQAETKEQQHQSESDDDINLMLLKQKSTITKTAPPKFKEVDNLRPSITITKTSTSKTAANSQQIISTQQSRVVHVRTVKAANSVTAPTIASTPPTRQTQQIITSPVVQKRTLVVSSSPSSSITVQSPPLSKTTSGSTKMLIPSKALSPLQSTQYIQNNQPIIAQKISVQQTQQSQLQQHQRTTTALLSPTISNMQNQSFISIEPASKKMKIDCDSSNFEKLLTLACNRLTQFEENEDDYGVFGKMVTSKLRTMDGEQSLIAQKLITDILFDGQMKLLQLPQQQQQQQTAYITTNAAQIPQQLHATTIRSLRGLSTNGQTFFLSDLNGSNQFSTSDNDV